MVNHQESPKLDELEFIYCTVVGCKKAFLYRSEVERHLITHNNSKPFACPFEDCDKSFKRQDALRVHFQSHSEEPQFFCSIPGCGAKFKAKPALKYHLSKHQKLELKLMSDMSGSSPESQNSSHKKTKSVKKESSRRESSDCLSKEDEEEIDPKPTKFLFQEGGETKPNTSSRSLIQVSNKDDKELRELKIFCSRLMRENRELKRQLADEMMSFGDNDIYRRHYFEEEHVDLLGKNSKEESLRQISPFQIVNYNI